MSMENHLMHRYIPGMAKTKVRRRENVRVKMNGIIIVPKINIKTLFRIGRDRKSVVR